MSETQTIEGLKSEWLDAKKAADSLTANFRHIEVARLRVAVARKRYVEALRALAPD